MLWYLLVFYGITTMMMIILEVLSFRKNKYIFFIKDYVTTMKGGGFRFSDIILFIFSFPYFILLFIAEIIIKSFIHKQEK